MRGGFAQQHKRQQGPYDKEHGVKPVEQQGLLTEYFRSVIAAKQAICVAAISREVITR